MKTLLLTLLLSQSPGTEAEWSLNVRHDHAFGSCQGQLIITNDSVRYETDESEDAQSWSYPDIEFFEILSASTIRIHTYENRTALHLWQERDFTLELNDGNLAREIYSFLRDRSPRPVVMRVPLLPFGSTDSNVGSPAQDRLLQELPVRHDHVFGGCQGMLTVREGSIVYSTDHSDDSRMWRLAEVESFASTGDFDLRISTRNETFHFDLKVPLNRETYQHIWDAVYEPQIQSYRGGVR